MTRVGDDLRLEGVSEEMRWEGGIELTILWVLSYSSGLLDGVVVQVSMEVDILQAIVNHQMQWNT